MTNTDILYMQRCIDLARLGAGNVAPNPMVGAVLVHGNRIIGEGHHAEYGKAHAEVNCFNSVSSQEQDLVKEATLYVSLEPCAHFGKTPPCSDLIIQKQVPKVVIGCRDPFTEVNGRGIEKLQNAGVEVITGVLEKECQDQNRRFFTYVLKKRPYIILKWAQTADGKIASTGKERLLITHENTNRLVHRWRSEEAAILVGTNTALHDDPALNNRLWTGRQPVRMILDKQLRLPRNLKIFNGEQPTIILNELRSEQQDGITFRQLSGEGSVPARIAQAAYANNLQSILVEGGAILLQSFINAGLWDEARIITNETLVIGEGLSAPNFEGTVSSTEKIGTDTIVCYRNRSKHN